MLKKYVLQKWWIPWLLFVISILFYVFLVSSTNNTILELLDYSLLFTTTLLLIAGVWQVFKGKWYLGLLQLVTLFIGGFLFIIVSTFMSSLGSEMETFATI